MKTLDVICVEPKLVAAQRYDGSPDGARLELTVSLCWSHAGKQRKLQIGQTSYRIPSFVEGTVELAWPYIEGSTFSIPGSLSGNPPPTDSLPSSSEER